MAVLKMLPQICVLLTALYSFVSSQQATAPADSNSLFTNLLATSNSPGQGPADPNTPSFGNPNMGGSAGFGAPMGQNLGFLGGQPGGMQSRGYPMSQMGGMSSNAAPAPAPRPGMSQNSLMPYMLFGGSDVMQRMAMMSMLGGGAGMGGGAGGMFSSPMLMYGLMNM
ncbi:hypothetical protein BsWGS_23013 [Bradybaena similaris]